jgi:hypothetical protein
VSQGNYPPGGQNPFSDKPQGPTNPYQPGQFTGVNSGGPGPRGPVKNYLVESILCLIFCGGLFAIPAIVYACQVNSKLGVGDYNGAVQASQNAKKWCIIAVCIGVVCGGISIVAQIAILSQGGPL